MHPSRRLVLVVLVAGLAAATGSRLHAGPPDTADRPFSEILKNRDRSAVYVVRQGQFYHRHDHLLLVQVTPLTPEAAIEDGYSPCPECTPPDTAAALKAEMAKATPPTAYYRFYVSERENPTSTAIPVGSGTRVAGGGWAGAAFGQGLPGGTSASPAAARPRT